MRSDGGNRVLDDLDPAFAVALHVLVIIKRYNLVFEQTIDGSSIKLILIALVLISALFGQRPSCTLTISFKPPTVEHRKVDNTIHLSLFA